VVYSVDNVDSFNAVNKWMTQIRTYAPEDVKVLLLGNKIDLANYREVGTDVGKVIRVKGERETRRSVLRSVGFHWRKCAPSFQDLGSRNNRRSGQDAGSGYHAAFDPDPKKSSYQRRDAATNKC